MRIVTVLLVACLLGSCSITAPRDVGNANMITLSAPDNIGAPARKLGVLKVDYPSAPSDLDTYRIAVAKVDGRQDYFAGARWNEFLPSVVQSALTEALAKGGRFTYVDSDEGNINNNYLLRVDIEECRAIYTAERQPPQAVIRMVFNLTTAYGKNSLITFRLEEKTQASANSLTAIAAAFNTSFGSIAKQAITHLNRIK